MDTEMAFGTTKNSVGDIEMSCKASLCILLLATEIMASTDNAWMHRFYYHCHSAVLDYVCAPRKHNYEAILELDKRVRDFYVPPSLRVPGLDKESAAATGEKSTYQDTAQRCDVCATKSWSRYTLHA
jgi:hypothetical protein